MRRLRYLTAASKALALCTLAACAENPVIFEVSLEQPSAVVFADGLKEVSFVASQAIYFPLRIPSGPAPEAMLATEDGRFVAILDWMTERVQFLDADALSFATANGVQLDLDLGAGSKPHSLALVPGCGAGCSGRIAVSLEGLGSVAVFEVRESDDGVVSVGELNVFDVGGAPSALAVAPDSSVVFVSDSASNDVIRLELDTGSTERLDVGGIPGALAVSTDGSRLLVTRSAYKDAVVVEGLAAGMQVVDANARVGPVPSCVPACDDARDAAEQCPGAHPADLALCSDDTSGLTSAAEAGNVYKGLYFGFVPSAVRALGVAASNPVLDTPCCLDSLLEDDSEACDEYVNKRWDEYFVVAGLDGNVVFVGGVSDGELVKPAILTQGWCRGAGLQAAESQEDATDTSAEPTTLDPSLVLEGCPSLPDGRVRFLCVEDEALGFGVGLLPGRRPKTSFTIEWEGMVSTGSLSLPNLERSAGGGTLEVVDGETYLGDTGINLSAFGDNLISQEDALFAGLCSADGSPCGDIVEFIEPLLGEPACVEALGDEPVDGCSLERRILSVDSDGDGALRLDRAVPEACLPQSGRIAYRIRMGDAYRIYMNGETYRALPGANFGVGGDGAYRESVVMTIKNTELDYRALGACARYGESGLLVAEPAFTRDLRAEVDVYDGLFDIRDEGTLSEAAYSLRVDVLYDADGRQRGAGQALPQLHQGMAVYDRDPANPIIFNAYAASDALIGFIPTAVVSSQDDSTAEAGDDAAEAEEAAYTPTGLEFRTNSWFSEAGKYRVLKSTN